LTAEKVKNNTFKEKESVLIRQASYVVEGANLRNEYGSKLFADFFSL
jgi:hypothetical protein